MTDDDQTLTLAVSTLLFAICATCAVAFSTGDTTRTVAKSGYGIDAGTVSVPG